MKDANRRFIYKDGHLYHRTSLGGVIPGTYVGTLDAKGYWRVGKDRRSRASVVWEMHFGPIPDGYIVDHINRDRQDDRIENLQLATSQDNARNQRRRDCNTSGIVGVHYDPVEKKWRARINADNGRIDIYWGPDFFEACCRRKSAELMNNYSFTHGEAI